MASIPMPPRCPIRHRRRVRSVRNRAPGLSRASPKPDFGSTSSCHRGYTADRPAREVYRALGPHQARPRVPQPRDRPGGGRRDAAARMRGLAMPRHAERLARAVASALGPGLVPVIRGDLQGDPSHLPAPSLKPQATELAQPPASPPWPAVSDLLLDSRPDRRAVVRNAPVSGWPERQP